MKLIILFLFLIPNIVFGYNFAVISDPHLEVGKTLRADTSRRISISSTLLQNSVTSINNDKTIDFTIITGDLLNSPRPWNLDSAKYILDKLEKPYFVVIGNNDFAMFNSGLGISKNTFHQTFTEHEPNFSNSIWHFSPIPEILLVGIDNISPLSGGAEWTKKMITRLEEILSENSKKDIILLLHYPITELDYFNDGEITNGSKPFLDICQKYNSTLILSGHYHYQEFQKFGNLLNIVVPALIEYPHSYKKISITDSKITINSIGVINKITKANSLVKTKKRIQEIIKLDEEAYSIKLLEKISGEKGYIYDKK